MTGFQASDGGDVGYKLCKAGTRSVYTVTIGYKVIDGIDFYYGFVTLSGVGTIGGISPNTLFGYTIAGFYTGFVRPNRISFYINLNSQRPWTGLNVTFLDDNTTWNMPKYSGAPIYGFFSDDLSDHILKRRYEQGIRQVQVRITVY